MASLFHEILYRPLLNALIVLYHSLAFEDLGLAIILLTVVVRLILFPFFYKGLKHQAVLQRLQPEIKKIQHDHKHDRERQAQALLELYRANRVNPLSGFVVILLQIPILIALYRVFAQGITNIGADDLYAGIAPPASLDGATFLGLINLQASNILIVGLAAYAQYLQGRLAAPRTNAPPLARQMVFIGPAITALFLFSLPAAVGLYWLTSSLFSVGQQHLLNRSLARGSSPQNHGSGNIRTKDTDHREPPRP